MWVKGIDDEDLLDKIDGEGFDYFFRYYISLGNIQEPQLRQLAEEYQVASERLEEYLRELEDSLPEEQD